MTTCGYKLDAVDGLHELAAQCDAAAAALTSTIAPAIPAQPCQATAAATTCGYTHLEAAAAVLARRAATIGSKLRAAARVYIDQDKASAEQISTVGQSIQA